MYITFYKTKTTSQAKSLKQITFEEYLLGAEFIDTAPITAQESEIKRVTVQKDKDALKQFYMTHFRSAWMDIPKPPAWPTSELHDHYHSFDIPKKTGGLRHIDAPDDELKLYLTQIKLYFENVLKILPHDAAHAYTKGRSVVTDLQVHQKANTNWFLKLDLKDFFPSHNIEYVMKTLNDIYPIGFLLQNQTYKEQLQKALEYAFLDGKLPQGTPLSPTLTNLLMVPIDYEIQHTLWSMKKDFVYTRYADDMTISSPYNFTWSEVQKTLESILTKFDTPFKIKTEKTRYGSKAGRNWNFGIMLNKDNNMTIGHKRNQQFRAMIHNLLKDYLNGTIWPREDRARLGGLISYYKMIEPEYIEHVLRTYESKFNLDIKAIIIE